MNQPDVSIRGTDPLNNFVNEMKACVMIAIINGDFDSDWDPNDYSDAFKQSFGVGIYETEGLARSEKLALLGRLIEAADKRSDGLFARRQEWPTKNPAGKIKQTCEAAQFFVDTSKSLDAALQKVSMMVSIESTPSTLGTGWHSLDVPSELDDGQRHTFRETFGLDIDQIDDLNLAGRYELLYQMTLVFDNKHAKLLDGPSIPVFNDRTSQLVEATSEMVESQLNMYQDLLGDYIEASETYDIASTNVDNARRNASDNRNNSSSIDNVSGYSLTAPIIDTREMRQANKELDTARENYEDERDYLFGGGNLYVSHELANSMGASPPTEQESQGFTVVNGTEPPAIKNVEGMPPR